VFGGFGGNDYNIQLLELQLTAEKVAKNTILITDAIASGVEACSTTDHTVVK
jgi:hypothetical protein